MTALLVLALPSLALLAVALHRMGIYERIIRDQAAEISRLRGAK